MIGTNDRTLRPKNGEQNVKGLVGCLFSPGVANPYRLLGYGSPWQVSNKPSEHNVKSIAVTRATFFPAAPQLYSRQTNRIVSKNVVFPVGRSR